MSESINIRVTGDGPTILNGPNLSNNQYRTVSSGGPLECPLHHPKESPDPNCNLCRVAIDDPRHYDVWAGNKTFRKLHTSSPNQPEVVPSNYPSQSRTCEANCPGTELKKLLLSLGIEQSSNCACNTRAQQMDIWGTEGCKEHRNEIIKWMQEEAAKLGWWEKVSIAVTALKVGMVLKFNPFDPAPGLVDEAIRRASIDKKPSTVIEPPWEEDNTNSISETKFIVNRTLYKWSYGVTGFYKRRELLKKTLDSLKISGFDKPHLFLDGVDDPTDWYKEFQLPFTVRYPKALSYPNWVLSLHELLLRDRHADRFALFQDDLVCVKGLKEYLDHCEMAPKTYWNLYTYPKNLKLAIQAAGGKSTPGWYPTDQGGRGALGLVFSRQGVIDLLTQRHLFDRLYSSDSNIRWWRFIDGAVVDSLKKEGYTELCHNPSLLQHTGHISTQDRSRKGDGRSENFPEYKWDKCTYADSFPGEEFDVMTLVNKKKV